MTSRKVPDQQSEQLVPKQAAAADSIRRKLIKAGAIGIPVTITLQSGTAWAASTCATRLLRPTDAEVDAALSDPANQATISSSTGLSSNSIDKIIQENSAIDPGQAFPETGIVSSGEVLWLRVNSAAGGSCWTSFCDFGVGNGITVAGHKSGQVCDSGGSGSNNGFGNGDQDAPGGSDDSNNAENDGDGG